MPASNGTLTRSFRKPGGGEHVIVVEPPEDRPLHDQIAFVQSRYAAARHALGLAPGTALFRRLFVSDIINQAELLGTAGFQRDPDGSPVAVSMIQQPPLSRAKISLLAYHVDTVAGCAKTRISDHDVIVERGGLDHLYTGCLCAAAGAAPDAAGQTRDVFGQLTRTLENLGGTLRDNCMRTWLFLKDVDIFYQDMVGSRSEIFRQEGLTMDTHYIASTGIEGACRHRYDVVAMDAYSVLGLQTGQVSYLNDFDRLCPTADYNVTFERGTRIAYADRAHVLISGTASIDRAGRIVHPGDVALQLDRAMSNVGALLQAGGAGFESLMYLIVYLRDPADAPIVRAVLESRFPHLPLSIVQGAVCRPEWLVEVEGIAITGSENPAMPQF
jgi:enamine deaminase RidA (YjgF/YER057c/UK114 family)